MKKNRKWTLAAVIAAAALALVFACFRSAAVEAVYPVEKGVVTVKRSLGDRLRGLFEGVAVAAENRRLKRELDAVALLAGENAALAAENSRLRKALGFAERSRGEYLPARVLSRGGGAAGARRTLRIDRGEKAGVTVGAVVVVPDGLVGRVTAVTEHTAEVLLISDPELKVACILSGARMTGILTGGASDRLVLRYLSGVGKPPARVQVVTSGLGGVFPPGLAIGTLVNLRDDTAGIAPEGDVEPAIDFAELEEVFVRNAR